MIFNIIFVVILLITLVTLIGMMYSIIISSGTIDYKDIVLCGIGTGLVGFVLGMQMGSILFNI